MTAPVNFEIRINPEYESLVPPMTREAFDSLVSSLRANGQHEPITVNGKGEVLDGHHRLKACQLLKLKPDFNVKSFDNPLSEKLYVIDVNLQRRQLTQAQKVELSLRKKPILEELAKLNESLGGKGVQICTPLGRVNEVIASDCGVSARQVSKIETILNRAPEELKNRVLAGTTSPNKAYRKVMREEARKKLVNEALDNSKIDFPDRAGVQLIHGDFIDIDLPDESIDLIFTDPPYGEDSLHLYVDLARIADRVLKKGGSLVTYVNHCLIPETTRYMEDAGLARQWILATKLSGPFARFHPKKVSIKWKPLLWFIKGENTNSPDYISDFIESEQPDKEGHDWEQSPKEAEHVIDWLTVENQIVFDPMMGYATTGIAAVQLNRKFVGIEKDEEHFKTAQLRIARELKKKEAY